MKKLEIWNNLKKNTVNWNLKFYEFSNISLRKARLTQGEIQHEPPREFFSLLDIYLFKVSVIMNVNNRIPLPEIR